VNSPVRPPGWPADLPPPQTDAFRERVPAWLLDRAPAGFRAAAALRAHPPALARIVAYTCTGEVEALRAAYGAVRRELGDSLTADQVDSVLVDLEALGARSAETLRQVDLVVAALAGATWRERL
jgi:hypothetical protein